MGRHPAATLASKSACGRGSNNATSSSGSPSGRSNALNGVFGVSVYCDRHLRSVDVGCALDGILRSGRDVEKAREAIFKVPEVRVSSLRAP